MHRDFMAAVAGLELTQKQTATLWLIQANPGVSQVSVAAALGMDRATMMSITDRLEERGFVIRKRSTVDRRRQELYLTPPARARCARSRRESPSTKSVSRRCSSRRSWKATGRAEEIPGSRVTRIAAPRPGVPTMRRRS